VQFSTWNIQNFAGEGKDASCNALCHLWMKILSLNASTSIVLSRHCHKYWVQLKKWMSKRLFSTTFTNSPNEFLMCSEENSLRNPAINQMKKNYGRPKHCSAICRS
jgi:hypothetical protein